MAGVGLTLLGNPISTIILVVHKISAIVTVIFNAVLIYIQL